MAAAAFCLSLACTAASAAELPSTPEDGWVVNSQVLAIARTADTTYLGGSFTLIGPNRPYGVPLDATSGQLVATYPKPNGSVRCCVPDGAGGWYIGGEFTKVGAVDRNRLAHIKSDGTVDAAWDPNANNGVSALAVSGSTVYVGGIFTTIGATPITRNRLAAIGTDGTLAAWNPDVANGGVNALAVSGSTVYVGGSFTTVGGTNRNRLAAIGTDGTLAAWNPNASAAVLGLAVSGSTVYVGGTFTTIGATPITRNRLAAIGTDGTLAAWNPNANNQVSALAVSGTTVYVGGTFTTIGATNTRNRLAAIGTDGTLAAWDPNANNAVNALAVSGTTVYVGGSFTTIGATPIARNRLAAIGTDGTLAAWDPNAIGSVSALAVSGTTVYVGGLFTSINATARQCLAALGTDGTLTAWDPSVSGGAVLALAVSDSTVYAGGTFTTIGGSTRNRLAAIGTDGTLAAWDPNASGGVNALAVSGTTVYVGGSFTTIGATPITRNSLAAIGTDGVLAAWHPTANSTVYALAVSGTTVYVGGSFTTIDVTNTRNYLAAIGTDGTLAAWDPNANNAVNALAVSGTTVYVGGSFTTIGVTNTRRRLAAIGTDGTLAAWDPNANNVVYALAVSGTTVYVGGLFTTIGATPIARNRLAAIGTDGTLAAWDPNANNTVVALAVSAGGSPVYAGGYFTTLGGNPCYGFAQFGTNPVATTTTTTLASSLNPSTYGASVTFTATVSPSAATGLVTFKDGAATLGTGTLSGGVATFATSSLSAGGHTITAEYAGDGSYATSTSSAITQTVNKATPTVTVWPTASAITYGQTLASSTLSGGTASVGGTFAWTTSSTAPEVGAAAQDVTFTPTVTANYNTVTGTASVTVTPVTRRTGLSGPWSSPSTWSDGIVPLAGEDVVISDHFFVTLDIHSPAIRNLTVIGTLALGTNTLTLSGAFTNTGTFDPGTGTVVLTGGNDQTLSATAPGTLTFYNLTLNKDPMTATVTAASTLKVDKKLAITSGKLVSASDYADILIETDGELVLTGDITVSGDFTNAGTLTTAGHCVIFDGGFEQNLTLPFLTWFDDVTVTAGTTLIETESSDSAYVGGTLLNYGVLRKTQPVDATGEQVFGLAGLMWAGEGAYAAWVWLSINVTGRSGADPLTAIQVDCVYANHPQAPGTNTTGMYWTVTPTGGDFTADVFLPQNGLADPQAGRYRNSAWDWGCDAADDMLVVRTNLSAFGDFAVFNDPQFTTTTTTALASSLNPSTYGSNVTFTATVSPSAATGLVTFKDGAATLGTGTLSGGVATFATSSLSAGGHTITAEYAGDSGYSGSTSATLSQTVTALPVTRTWTGADGNANWTTAGNWGGAAPAAGDTLVFPASAVAYIANNDFAADTRFSAIQIDIDSYTFSGNAIQLDNGVTTTHATGIATLPLGITLRAPQTVTVGAGGTLSLAGKLTGTGGITKAGTGGLGLSSTTSDYSGGTTIAEGTVYPYANSALGSGAVTIASGAELSLEVLTGITLANAISVTGTGTSTYGAIINNMGTNTLSGPITLTGDGQFYANAGQTLTLSGAIGDGGNARGLTLDGGGVITFKGTVSNTYTGDTTVSGTGSGELDLHKTGGAIAIAGNLIINKTVKNLSTAQIADTAIVTVNGGGRLNINGYSDTIGGLVLNGAGSAPTVSTGIGALTLASGGGLTTSGNTSPFVSQYLALAAGPHTLDIGPNLSLSFNSGFTGSGDVVKTGSGTLMLGGDNGSFTARFTGSLTINAGRVMISNAKALGTGVVTTTVNDGGTLEISGGSLSISHSITLAGNGAAGAAGALVNTTLNSLTSTLSGQITLAADATIATASGSALNFTGVIGETGGSRSLTLAGRGSVFFTSSTGNSYTGRTYVKGGSNLWLNGGAATVRGALTVGDGVNGSVLQDQASGQISSSAVVTVAAGSTLRLLGVNETIASLSLQSTAGMSATLATGTGALTLAAGGGLTTDSSRSSTVTGTLVLAAGSHDINLGTDLSLTKLSGSGDLTKLGVGSLKLIGANDGYSGSTTISAGQIDITSGGALGSGPVTVQSDASLSLANGITVANPVSLVGYGVSSSGALLGKGGDNVYTGPITLAGDAGIGVSTNTLTVSQVAGSSAYTLRESGSGTLIVTGTPAFAGTFDVVSTTSNVLQVDGTLPAASIIKVNSAATLRGTGTTGLVTANSGGHVAPGHSAGTLSAAGLTLNSGALFDEEINGTTAGTLYDQMLVSGTALLGNATLNVTVGYTPALGDTYTILNAPGGVSGTFNDAAGNILTNGATFTEGGQAFRINYTSTTVTLAAILPTTTTLASSPNPSTYGSNVTFTATVSPSGATGLVTFKDGAATLGTGTLSGGVATFATSSLSAGGHTITAEYAGDASYSASGSSALSQGATLTVNQAVATVTLVNLSQTYDSAAKAVSVTTVPTNLTVTVTYDGSAVAPTNAGSYAVIGTVSEANYSGSATNTLAINKATPSVTVWPTASAITYGQTLASSTLSGGSASVGGTFAWTTAATAPGAGTASQGVTFTPTDVANYASVTGSVNVTVNQAVATVTLGNLSQTYDSAAKAVSVTTEPTNLTVTVTYDGSAVAPTNAGSYAVIGTVSEANYAGSATNTLVINRATPTATLAVNNSPQTYDGTAKSATVAITASSVTGTVTGILTGGAASQTNAGTYAVTADFLADDAANYSNLLAQAAGSFVISPATPSVTAWPTASAITYGQTLASSTLSNGVAAVDGMFAWTTPATAPGVGTASQGVTFTPTDAANYNTVDGTVDVTVNKATPDVTAWPTASAISYGQTLTSSMLSGGSASVDGTFAWTAPATAPGVGTAAQALTFTPYELGTYNTVSGTADVIVNKATPSVAWPTASALTYGQTLASSTLSGGVASVDGTFAWTAPATAPGVGTAAQTVTFTPTDAARYATVNSPSGTGLTLRYTGAFGPNTTLGGVALGADETPFVIVATFFPTSPNLYPVPGSGIGAYAATAAITIGEHGTYQSAPGADLVVALFNPGAAVPFYLAGIGPKGGEWGLFATFTSATPQFYAEAPEPVVFSGELGKMENFPGAIPLGDGTYSLVVEDHGALTPATAEITALPATATPVQVTVSQAVATVSLGNLSQTYDSAAKAVSVTTEPTNLTVTVTYDGSAVAPTNAGSYAVIGTVSEANYSGSATNTLVINKATPTATLAVNNSPQTYDGAAKSATVVITASSVPGTVTSILTGNAASQTNAGTYAVTANFLADDAANYSNLLAQAAGSFVISPATPSVTAWPTASAIIFGQTLTCSTLSGGAGAGNFAWTTPSAAPNAGTALQNVTFTPADAANYASVTGAVSVAVSPVVATQAALGYLAGTPMTVDCTFTLPVGTRTKSLLWQPELPAGWTLTSVSGAVGAPEVSADNEAIVFVGSLATNTVSFRYTVSVPASATGTQHVGGYIEYHLDGMANPSVMRAEPDLLDVRPMHTLQIVSAYGTAAPAAGVYTNFHGATLDASVSDSETVDGRTFACAGWLLTGNEPASGSHAAVTLTLTNNAVLTWVWAAPQITHAEPVTVTMDEDNAPTAWAQPALSAVTTSTPAGQPASTLAWSLKTQGAHGVATVSGTNAVPTVTYLPTADWNGSDSFTVQVSDGFGGVDTVAVNVTVNPRNDAPVLTIPPQSVNRGTTLTFTATATDVDVPAQPLTFSLSDAPAGASITADGQFTWSPTDEQCLAARYTVTVKATDNDTPALSDEQTVTITVITATQDCPGLRSPSTTLVVSNSFAYAAGETLESLTWTPALPSLPAGWTVTAAAAQGSPAAVVDGAITVAGAALTNNPVCFTYTVTVPGNAAVSNSLAATVRFTLSGATLEVAVPPVAVYRYHSADYQSLLRKIDNTEMNRVLSYWRAGGYAYDTRGHDGYIASVGPGAGIAAFRHSADWQAPYGTLDIDEVALVQQYWRAGGYHVDPAGDDGYLYNRSGIGPRMLLGLSQAVSGALAVSVSQAGPGAYNPGQMLTVTNTFVPPSGKLLSLYWRFALPSGWTILSVSGDGSPSLLGSDVLYVAATLPSTPMTLVCTIQVPLTESRVCSLGSFAKYMADPMVKAVAMSNTTMRLPALDANRNGMADSWESVYAGGAAALDPDADADGDHLGNLAEYLCGTIPTDQASVLQVFALKLLADGQTQVSWSSEAGRSYTVLRADGTPDAAHFTTVVADGVAADPSGVNVCEDAVDPATPHFYRVKLVTLQD